MSWIGKILTMLVLILTLVWMWFTAVVYTTRTNWQNEAVKYKQAFEEAKRARQDEYARNISDREALFKKAESADKERAEARVAEASTKEELKKNREALAKALEVFNKADARVTELQASYDLIVKEMADVRKNSEAVENQRAALSIALAGARRDALSAKNEADLARSIVTTLTKQYDDLQAKLSEARQVGANSAGAPLRQVDRAPPAVPENFRGTVTKVDGNYVALSLGIDAGLANNQELIIYRLEDGGKYLGTVKVVLVQQKEAAAEFFPASGKSFDKLRPEDRPKVGDVVAPSTTLRTVSSK